MPRELPKTYLVRPAYQLDPHSDATEWVAYLKESDLRLGLLRKDRDALAPTTSMPWQVGIYTEGRQPLVSLGRTRTRKEAVELLAREWAKREDEAEAHMIADTVAQGTIEAHHMTKRQLETHPHVPLSVPESMGSLAGPLNGDDDRLADLLSMAKYSMSGHFDGTRPLDLDLLRRRAFVARMVELEIKRREKDRARFAQTLTHLTSKISHEEEVDAPVMDVTPAAGGNRSGTREDWDRFAQTLTNLAGKDQLVMSSRPNLLKMGDSPLVTELHEHLVSPWKLTTRVLDTLLDRVRKLEQLVAESGRG